MRPFLVLSSIALYVVLAFVPPSVPNLQAAMVSLRSSTLFQGMHIGTVGVPTATDVSTAAIALKNLVTKVGADASPDIFVNGGAGKKYAKVLADAAAGVLATAGQKTVQNVSADLRNTLGQQATYALSNMWKGTVESSAEWKKALKTEPDDTVREQLLIIESAIEKDDVRLCRTLQFTASSLREVNGKQVATPSHGDYLAYCIARVAGEGQRCSQIDADISPPLQSICMKEFAAQSSILLQS